jgi:hypothetical protein
MNRAGLDLRRQHTPRYPQIERQLNRRSCRQYSSLLPDLNRRRTNPKTRSQPITGRAFNSQFPFFGFGRIHC